MRAAPRPGRGWKVFALILLVLLLLSLVGHLGHFVNSLVSIASPAEHAAGPRLQETVIEDAGADEKIAVLDVEGMISSFGDGSGYSLVELIRYQLKRAASDREVKAVILRVNSPGGEVLASDEIYRLIEDFQAKTGKPVVASMGSLAASGGYYVSAPCRWIVANELTITGSIGGIMHGYNYRGLMDKLGLRPEVYKSGKLKDMLSPDKAQEEILPEERRILQGLIEETFGRFKQVVAAGRRQADKKNDGSGRKLAENWEDYADGRILSGTQALNLGFVDELGNFKTAVDRTKRLASLTKANLVRYDQPFELSNLFRFLGKTDAKSVKLDLGVDLPRLQIGHMYCLFQPGL